MIRINEWLPDPAGRDTEGEWIELANSGTETEGLSGFMLQTQSGGKFKIREGYLKGGERAVLLRRDTKLNLGNENGSLALYDPKGQIVDQVSFLGRASEGKSWSRGEDGFSWAKPTPGEANEVIVKKTEEAYPLGIPLAPSPQISDIVSATLLMGACSVAAVFIALKNSNDLYEQFFKTN